MLVNVGPGRQFDLNKWYEEGICIEIRVNISAFIKELVAIVRIEIGNSFLQNVFWSKQIVYNTAVSIRLSKYHKERYTDASISVSFTVTSWWVQWRLKSPASPLLNFWFRRRSKKTSKLRFTGLCVGNSPGIGEFPAQKASNAENVPFDDVIMQQHIQGISWSIETDIIVEFSVQLIYFDLISRP